VTSKNTSKPPLHYFCGFLPQNFFIIYINILYLKLFEHNFIKGVSMDKYDIFKKNINNLINIDLNYYKEKQMKRRITSLMNRNGFNNFDD
jgi:hypothetical protein